MDHPLFNGVFSCFQNAVTGRADDNVIGHPGFPGANTLVFCMEADDLRGITVNRYGTQQTPIIVEI